MIKTLKINVCDTVLVREVSFECEPKVSVSYDFIPSFFVTKTEVSSVVLSWLPSMARAPSLCYSILRSSMTIVFCG